MSFSIVIMISIHPPEFLPPRHPHCIKTSNQSLKVQQTIRIYHTRAEDATLTPGSKVFIIILLQIVQPSSQLTHRPLNNLLALVFCPHNWPHITILRSCYSNDLTMCEKLETWVDYPILEVDNLVVAHVDSMVFVDNWLIEKDVDVIAYF